MCPSCEITIRLRQNVSYLQNEEMPYVPQAGPIAYFFFRRLLKTKTLCLPHFFALRVPLRRITRLICV